MISLPHQLHRKQKTLAQKQDSNISSFVKYLLLSPNCPLVHCHHCCKFVVFVFIGNVTYSNFSISSYNSKYGVHERTVRPHGGYVTMSVDQTFYNGALLRTYKIKCAKVRNITCNKFYRLYASNLPSKFSRTVFWLDPDKFDDSQVQEFAEQILHLTVKDEKEDQPQDQPNVTPPEKQQAEKPRKHKKRAKKCIISFLF